MAAVAILAARLRAPADDGPAPSPAPADAPAAVAAAVAPVEPLAATPAGVSRAIDRGVAYLLAAQNPDGSWGSPRRTKDLNIYAPVPGAFQAYGAATTALCVSALIELTAPGGPVAGGGTRADHVRRAIDRGEERLLEDLPRVRRASSDVLYNVWAHAYGIEALVRMLRRHAGDAVSEGRIREAIRGQIDLLDRYQFLDGGWSYYEFAAHTRKPSDSSFSFVTATVLIALREAKDAGVPPPDRMVERALDSLRRQRKPDSTYLYGEYLKWRPERPVNRAAGSLGRSQACNLALRLWGGREITDGVLRTWLRKIHDRNLWLDIGRKRPIPHEAWFQVAGYFFYYGHHYAARCLEQLPAAERAALGGPIAAIIVARQEKDGSWFDFPLYDYHQPYGTAFALMTLARCRPARSF